MAIWVSADVGSNLEWAFKEDDLENQDMCSTAGFLYAVQLILSLDVGGSLLAAIVCSSWVTLSSSSTGRKVRMNKSDAKTKSRQVCNNYASPLVTHLQGAFLVGFRPFR